jgi:hypothetical protein
MTGPLSFQNTFKRFTVKIPKCYSIVTVKIPKCLLFTDIQTPPSRPSYVDGIWSGRLNTILDLTKSSCGKCNYSLALVAGI